MHRLNLLKKYFVDSQFFVALMGTALAVFFMLEQDTLKFPTILLIFITFFSGYLYTKYQNTGKKFRTVLIFNVISGLVSVALIIFNHNEVRLLKWLVIVLLGLLYDSSFLAYFVRRIPLFKIFYVGFTWALINSWLILPQFDQGVFWISLLFVSALVLPFDIRDMKSDEIVTFPRLIGVQKTKYFAYLLITASVLIAIFTLKTEFSFAMFATAAFTFVLIYFADSSKRDSYFSFWVESCSGIPLFLIILMKYF